MKLIRIRNIIIYFIVLLLSLTIFFVSTVTNSISKYKEKTIEIKNNNGYFQLSDKYDRKNSSIWDFYAREDSLSVLMDTYNMLNNNDLLSYYEFSNQSLEFIGDFKGDLSIVDGTDESYINQSIGNIKITPLYSLQLSKKIIEQLDLVDALDEGRTFSNDEYQLSNNLSVPVIMGSRYKKYFSVNDSFTAYYVGQVILNCKVIGFFEEGLDIDLANNNYDIDQYIIFPLLNIDMSQYNDNMDLFYKILLTIKSEGYVYYDSLEDKIEQIEAIKHISLSTGFEYDLESVTNQSQVYDFWNITYSTSKVLLIISSVIFIIIVFTGVLIYVKKELNNVFFKIQKEKSLYKFKVLVFMTVALLILYVIAYLLTGCIFSFVNYNTIFMGNIVYINLFLLVVYVVSLFYVSIRINQIKVKEIEDGYSL